MIMIIHSDDHPRTHLSEVTSPTSFHRLKRLLNSAGSPLSITLVISYYYCFLLLFIPRWSLWSVNCDQNLHWWQCMFWFTSFLYPETNLATNLGCAEKWQISSMVVKVMEEMMMDIFIKRKIMIYCLDGPTAEDRNNEKTRQITNNCWA